ncbi:MAG: NAD(P)H-hydrate repair Nnr-like enzyme with NAD(P)H-hydrate epimerase domain, partial [Sediminicola sp.]
MKIFSSEQLNQADKITTEKQQISSVDLMESAGN